MKNTSKAFVLVLICFLFSCTKEPQALQEITANNNHNTGYSTARYAGNDYSQSISPDSAAAMMQSYQGSVGTGTDLQSVTFNADSLRAYLQSHPEVGTLKFMLAHQAAYKNSAGYGKYAGMNSNAMTILLTGVNDDSKYVLNSRNGVFVQSSGSSFMSVPADSANGMIQSYLTSVNYPSMDTAVRSLNFDADTMRAYLDSRPEVRTLKFAFAHQPAYKNSGNNGKFAGMNPNAMTMIVIGLNSNNELVLNNRNGLYEHFKPCPNYCPGNVSPLIQ